MRTIRIKLYKFSELSKDAKQKAIEDFRNNETFDFIYNEAFETVKKFAEIFSIKIRDFDFQETYRSRYTFEMLDNVLELSGQRLATYIWNNFKTDLFKGKYYSLWSKTEKSYQYYKEGYPVLKSRHSRILLDNCCVLTGVCYDDDMLQPIYDFLNKPTDIDFKELLEDCISEVCKSVMDEVEGSSKDDAIAETIEANEYEFTKDGKLS